MDVAHISGISNFGQQLIGAIDPADARNVLQIGAGTGGGGTSDTTLSLIQDMSTLARAFNSNTLTTPQQMRNIIGAGTGNSNVAIGTAPGTAASWDDLDSLNTTVNNLQTQINALSSTVAGVVTDMGNTVNISALANTPIIYTWNGASWQTREATPRPIWWIGGPSSPPATGSISGGGGLATIDLWLAKPLVP